MPCVSGGRGMTLEHPPLQGTLGALHCRANIDFPTGSWDSGNGGYLFAMLDNWSSLFWDCLLRDNGIICPAQEDKYLVCLLLSRLNYKKILSGQIWMMFKKMAEAFDVDYYEKLNSMLLCTDNFFQGLFFQGWQLNVEDNWIICII